MKSLTFLAVIASTALISGCQSLSGGSNSSDPIVITEPAVIDPIQSTFLEGDTLWDFAERTTGSGFNWEKIMILNGIEDERDIDAGIVLLVPPELAVEELTVQ